MSWMDGNLGRALAGLVIVMVVWIVVSAVRRSRAAERRLIARAGRSRAISLIEFEQKRNAGLSRSGAAKRAWERWIYDQSR